MKKIQLIINGMKHDVQVQPWETLLDVLRDKLGYTGTKKGCGLGECGSCTVIMNNKAVNSCLILAMEAHKHEISTIEGIKDDDKFHPLQESFIDHAAVQCGFCTPGMIMSAKALLDENPQPTVDEIETSIGGNLCRCTGYKKIVEAIQDAVKRQFAR